ncbi:hypothetical protein DPEC_G00220930 [Dallia pectoralis]|uniref:Uncharacterized protein n=1 Tax=Dallia pectoralis TaxID=75939 RepID=A0ACC2G3X3_DALPE|nr:hypothetical protein DPEC_G00220930 [Dallia pectoralis]
MSFIRTESPFSKPPSTPSKASVRTTSHSSPVTISARPSTASNLSTAVSHTCTSSAMAAEVHDEDVLAAPPDAPGPASGPT